MMGGGLGQAGILAAGCIYALDHHVERLAEDHANARALAEGLAELPGVEIDPETVETNIVIFEVPDAALLAERLAGEVEVPALDLTRMPAVNHSDVDREQIDVAPQTSVAAL